MFPITQLPNIVIFANGEPSTDDHSLQLLNRAQTIICCDGAVQKLLNLGYEPDRIIGDCDSITPELHERYKGILIRDESTEYNDLQKALRYVIAQGHKSVAILSSFGYREDHAIANLSIAALYAPQIEILMVTQHGIFVPINSTRSFRTHKGQQISIFSFNPEIRFTFHGLRYPVKDRKFSYLWEGSLNEAIGKEIIIECDGGDAAVYFAHKKEW